MRKERCTFQLKADQRLPNSGACKIFCKKTLLQMPHSGVFRAIYYEIFKAFPLVDPENLKEGFWKTVDNLSRKSTKFTHFKAAKRMYDPMEPKSTPYHCRGGRCRPRENGVSYSHIGNCYNIFGSGENFTASQYNLWKVMGGYLRSPRPSSVHLWQYLFTFRCKFI